MDTLKKALSSAKKYIFVILTFVFFYVALFFKDANLLSVFVLMNVLSVFLILNILSKLKYSFVLFLLLTIACTIDTFFAFYYKDNILFGILASVIETNTNEATGVSKALFPIWITVFIVNFILLFFAKKELKEIKLNVKSSLLLLVGYFTILISSFFISIHSNIKLYSEFDQNTFAPISSLAKERCPIIYYTLPDLGSYYIEMRGYKQYEATSRTLPNGIAFDEKKSQLQKVYFIIGESSSSKYFSLYDYPKKTTPFLDSLKQNKSENLIYYKGFSPAALTREAIRLTLTYASANHLEDFYEYKNIVELAKESGYETYWLSNQYRGGSYDTYIAMIAKHADYSRFEINSIEDFSLIEAMQPFLEDDKKQIFFLHTTGSHMPYWIGSDSLDIEYFPGKDNETQYLRTIHHVDRVLEKVANIVMNDSVPAALFYYSDHGEIIGKGHGFVNNVTPEEMLNQFSVPIISFMNDAAKEIVKDDTFKKYFDPEMQKISSQNMINIISETIGYNINDNFVKQSIENGRYIYHVDTKCYYYKDMLKGDK